MSFVVLKRGKSRTFIYFSLSSNFLHVLSENTHRNRRGGDRTPHLTVRALDKEWKLVGIAHVYVRVTDEGVVLVRSFIFLTLSAAK